MRKTVPRFKVLILVVALLPASGIAARAEPVSIDDAAIIQEIIRQPNPSYVAEMAFIPDSALAA